MPLFTYPFDFNEGDTRQVRGFVELAEPLPYPLRGDGHGFYRPGRIAVEGCQPVELVLYHNQATAAFIYLRRGLPNTNLLATVGLDSTGIDQAAPVQLPGQLCLGSERSKVIGEAMDAVFKSPPMQEGLAGYGQENLAVFPIAREGLKYQVAEAIFDNYGHYCDEIVLDAHHVFDSSVPVYNRKVEMTLFKDKDLDLTQRQNIRVAFLADSIASGMVMKEVISKVKQRFGNLQLVEVISPLTTVRGLTRIVRSEDLEGIQVRVHVFETLLNALPPDYYYSAHINIPELHIRPDLEQEYRAWWGQDDHGIDIADTACAGYGWSEVFYSPRKQIQMMNGELQSRHGLNIADIVRRNMAGE
jgi:hypothetical protein